MGYTLRPYQKETIKRLKENWEKNKRRNLCVLGTGAGKTVIATEFHKQFKTGKRTLFIVPRIELAYQAKESFLKSDPRLSVGIEMNTSHASKDDDVVIASAHSIGRSGSYRIGKFDPEDFEKVIVDEAHYSVTDLYLRILNYIGAGPENLHEDTMLVGLTATPNREDGVALGHTFDEITVNYGLSYLIRQGWLTDIDLFHGGQMGPAQILKAYKEYAWLDRTIVYADSVDEAHKLTKLFNEHHVNAFCIEADTDKEDRKQAIDDFSNGDIRVLFNYNVLNLGFDEPKVKCIMLGRKIGSELLLRQIIGRGVRPSPYAFVDYMQNAEQRRDMIEHSPKPACKVIDFHKTLDEDTEFSPPTLFGLNPKIGEDNKERFFKEVVEPLEEVQREHGVDISEIEDVNEVESIVEHKDVKLESLEVPDEVEDHTNRAWVPVGDEAYEVVYQEENKSLIVEKNRFGHYDLIENDNKKDISRKINEFYTLPSAIKVGDEYADRHYDAEMADMYADMKEKGVTRKQKNLLLKLYKGGIKVSRNEKYSDTNQPVLYYRNTGNERLDRARASNLIQNRIGK